jgi:hypothetical protein
LELTSAMEAALMPEMAKAPTMADTSQRNDPGWCPCGSRRKNEGTKERLAPALAPAPAGFG